MPINSRPDIAWRGQVLSKIHIYREGKTYGPYSLEDLRQQLGSGRLKDSDLAAYEGASRWIPLSQLPGVREDPHVPLGPLTSPHTPAGLWIRFAAFLFDLAVNGTLILLLLGVAWTAQRHLLDTHAGPVHGHYWSLVILLSLWLVVLTEAILTASGWSGSVGKRIFKIKVTDNQGGRLKLWRSIGRTYLKWSLFWITLLCFPILLLISKKRTLRQALHDKMVETLVVRMSR